MHSPIYLKFKNRQKYFMVIEVRMVVLGGILTGNGHKGAYWDADNILYPDLSSECTLGVQFSSVTHVQLFATPWFGAHQASLSFTISRSLLKFMSIELVMPSNHLILCHSLLLLPLIFPNIKVFSNESALHIRWPKLLELQHNSLQRIFRIDFL